MNQKNQWDEVSDKFNTYKKEVWHGAAENIATLWPAVLNFIKQNIPEPKGLRALEFGCGTGMFCQELFKLGFNATGIDISPEMIKVGKENSSPETKLLVGDTHTAKSLAETAGKFNVVTALMVLQFIEVQNLTALAESVADNGCIIFANHNPENLKARGFTDTFTLSDTNTTVPIYIRTAEVYDKIFRNFGFKKLLEQYPEAKKQFLAKHNITRPDNVPKYMLLAYQKNRSD